MQKSLEISRKLYFEVTLNSAKIVLDYIGLSSLSTFLLVNLLHNSFTLNISILVFSTIYVIISWRMFRFIYPLIENLNSHKYLFIYKKFPLLVKLTYMFSLILLYIIFLLSFYVSFISVLPALLVGLYISFIGTQLIITVRFLKRSAIEYFLVISYIISGISIILSPFYTLSILISPLSTLLYKLVMRSKEWS